MGTKKNEMGIYDHSDITVGDIVIPAAFGHQLRSGAQWYPFAICAATTPLLTLVSEEGDMKWSTTLPDMPLRAIGRAKPEQMKAVNLRYASDRKQEREAEVKSAMAGINVVYRTEWTEYEHDEWASQRADGVSYAIDLESLKLHIKQVEAAGVPSCYNRASTITQAIVTPEFYAEILASTAKIITTPKYAHEGELGTFKARNV
jgi:hypothetical protein